jgi:chaperonin cofactor prefoldin
MSIITDAQLEQLTESIEYLLERIGRLENHTNNLERKFHEIDNTTYDLIRASHTH